MAAVGRKSAIGAAASAREDREAVEAAGVSVAASFAAAGVTGLDEACLRKLQELAPRQRREVLDEFLGAKASTEIQSPSKWLYSHARTRLSHGGARLHATRHVPGQAPPGTVRLPELPDVEVDATCLEKLSELDSLDRAQVIAQFVQDRGTGGIRNPSGWLYSHARSLLVDKQGKSKGKGKGEAKGLDTARSSFSAPQALEILVNQYQVDERAVGKFQELSRFDQVDILQKFLEASVFGIKDPSRWIFAKARTRLTQRAATRGMTQPAKVSSTVYVEHAEIPELPGVSLDRSAIDKLGELGEADRKALLEEFTEEHRKSEIRNPSGWLFGHARTKLSGHSGKGQSRQRRSV